MDLWECEIHMGTSYNGRFQVPDEPKGGGKWIAIGCAMIPLWSMPVFGVAVLAGSVGCFVKGGKMASQKKMYRRFHECCAVIGRRTRVSIRELAKINNMNKNDMRKYLQRMIAAGYFGAEAYLDLGHEELVLPPMEDEGHGQDSAGWKDMVFDLLHALKVDKYFGGERKAQAEKAQKEKTQANERPIPPESRPQEAPESKAQEEAKTTRSAADVKKTHMDDLERTLGELFDLNEKIADEAVSRRIDRIGTLTADIFRVVIEKPEMEQDVRKFMNYYLPTTLKLLKSYDMLEDQNYQSENIIASRKKIENVLDRLIEAYERLLDRLFHNSALDIAVDVDVLETMMAGDGLSSKGRMRMP